MMVCDKKVETEHQQNKKANMGTFVRAGSRTRDLWYRSQGRYLQAADATESIECSQATCI